MKTKHFFLFVVLLTLLSADCNKGPCHGEVVITNNSEQDIVIALLFKDAYGKCTLDGSTIVSGTSATIDAGRSCWERTPFDYYVIDAATYDNSDFTDCDSLYVDYDILLHWTMTKEELAAHDYKVAYP